MPEPIMDYNEFMELPETEQKEKLERYREAYTNRDLKKTWKLNDARLYKIIDGLGIQKKTRRPTQRKKMNKELPTLADLQAAKKEAEKKTASELKPEIVNEVVEAMKKQPGQPVKEDGFQFTFNGSYESDVIIRKLEKLQLLLDDEQNNFNIELTIKELG